MADPLVAVVIPTYNRPEFLREALASALAQDFKDFEVLVVDDASAYDVQALVDSFRDPRVSLHRHRRNIGVVQNWHWCLSAPRTRYVAILEDDCLWLPHQLDNAIEALERYPEAPFYCCATEVFGAGASGIHQPHWATAPTMMLYDWRDTGFGRQWLTGTPMSVCGASAVIRREALTDLFWGGKSWPWCHDYLTWGQLALKGSPVYNPHLGARYRYHESNITKAFRRQRVRAMAQLRYTMRFLATRAYELGGLRDLAAETREFSPAPLSLLLIALTAPESPNGLSQQARAIAKGRPDLALCPESTALYRLAARLGNGALTYADIAGRLLACWWPTLAT